jgi:hypothetical protein
MTTITTLKADIAAAQAIIDKAQPLADKLAEMQAAVARIAQTARTLDALRSQLSEAEATERIRAAAVARWTIENIRPADAGKGSPAARHTVTTTRIVHGLYGPEPVIERHLLSNLSPELIAAVIASEDLLPTYIRALDADAEQAIRKHARHVGRGYMAS